MNSMCRIVQVLYQAPRTPRKTDRLGEEAGFQRPGPRVQVDGDCAGVFITRTLGLRAGRAIRAGQDMDAPRHGYPVPVFTVWQSAPVDLRLSP